MHRVLIVDDDPAVRASLCEELTDDFDVASADCAEAALARLAVGPFDAIVSDVRMPGMGGVALLEQAATLDPSLVRIFLTGFADADVAESARTTGAYKLRKPWGDELPIMLANALRERERLDRVRRELDGYIHVSGREQSQAPRAPETNVIAHLETSLRALDWVRDVHVSPLEPANTNQTAASRSRPLGPSEVDGQPELLEQLAKLEGEGETQRNIRIRWERSVSFGEKVIDLALRQAADALHMNQLEDQVRQRSRELEAARHEMIDRDRLATLGALAASVAHDVRSPLSVLLSNQQMLEDQLRSSELWDDELEAICVDNQMALEMIQRIIESMQHVSAEPGASEPVDVGAVVRLSARLLRRQLVDAEVRLETVIEGDIFARATPGEVCQMLINLITNAAQAAPPGSVIRVVAANDGKDVTLTVSDEGPGITSMRTETIFAPFQTTKPGGMGLGLSISRAMARRHGGDLRLVDPKAPGARFQLVLEQAPR